MSQPAVPAGLPVQLDETLNPLQRLVAVMAALRLHCPWDAEQTHLSLVQYLIEETAESVEAIELDDVAAMREELGDLLLQVVFHALLGQEAGRFDLDDLATEVADKLIARHPYVFADDAVPTDPMTTWEQRKRAEKQRASAIDGIPSPLNTLARANKVVSRLRYHQVALPLAGQPIEAAELGQALLDLVARAQASGIDADQALRQAVRSLETEVRRVEAAD